MRHVNQQGQLSNQFQASTGVQNIKNYFKLGGQTKPSENENINWDSNELPFNDITPETTVKGFDGSADGEIADADDDDEEIQNLLNMKSNLAEAKEATNEFIDDAGFANDNEAIPQEMNVEGATNSLNKISDSISNTADDVANVAEDTTDTVAETLGTVASVDEGLETAGAVLDSTGIGAVIGVGLEIAGVIGTAISGLVDLFEPKEQPKPVIPDTIKELCLYNTIKYFRNHLNHLIYKTML